MIERKLKSVMALRDVGVVELCKNTGIAVTTFWRKCNSGSDFKQSEISAIRKFLSLSDEELIDIFFSES